MPEKPTESTERDRPPVVRTSLSSCPRPFVEEYIPWAYSLSDEQHYDLIVNVECVWHHILGRSCDVPEDERSGWHDGAPATEEGQPRIPSTWQTHDRIHLNPDAKIVADTSTREYRHARIVSDLVLERRATSAPIKTESVDQQKSAVEAKELGSFYTPAPIVDYIVSRTLGRKLHPDISDQEARTVTTIDPSCGDGNFLIGAAEYILAWWWLRLGREVSAVERARIVRCQLYGVDLDPEAVAGCRKNLAKIAGCEPDDIFNVRCGNSLIGIRQTTPEEYAKLGPHPNRDAYDNALLEEFKALKIKKDQQKWDADKGKTVSAGKVEMTLDDIRELHPFHWEYEFPSIFTPGHAQPKEVASTKKPTAKKTKKGAAEPRPNPGLVASAPDGATEPLAPDKTTPVTDAAS